MALTACRPERRDAQCHAGFYEITSPPVVTDKILIVGRGGYRQLLDAGAFRRDPRFRHLHRRLVWAWDSGNIDENECRQPAKRIPPIRRTPGPSPARMSSSGWSTCRLARGSRHLGWQPQPAEERYDSALVALDIATGKLRWSFQNVHHDLWDMDFPSQPSLVDVHTDQGVAPAIYIPAKTGNIFVLDRRTGKLLVPAPERPVPQGPAAGDYLSPTQPFSELSFRPREKLNGAMMWGATMFDQLACRIAFRRLRYDGPFTPPSTQGTLVFPGDLGMFEWGGIAVDPTRQIAIANPMSVPFVSRLIPRGPDNPAPRAPLVRLVRSRHAADVRHAFRCATQCFPVAGRASLHAATLGIHGRVGSEDQPGCLAASGRDDA